MKIDTRFPKQVAVVFVSGMTLAAVPLISFSSEGILPAVVVGGVLSTANVLAGFVAIEYSLDKSYNTLLATVLGGMGIRIVLMLAILVLLIKFAGLHMIALVVSTLGFYVLYLVLEILYIQRKVPHKP